MQPEHIHNGTAMNSTPLKRLLSIFALSTRLLPHSVPYRMVVRCMNLMAMMTRRKWKHLNLCIHFDVRTCDMDTFTGGWLALRCRDWNWILHYISHVEWWVCFLLWGTWTKLQHKLVLMQVFQLLTFPSAQNHHVDLSVMTPKVEFSIAIKDVC